MLYGLESRGGGGKFYIKATSLQRKLDKIKRIEKLVIEHRKIKLGFSIENKSEKDALEVKGGKSRILSSKC